MLVSNKITNFALDLRNKVINRLKVMIIRLILIKVFAFMGTKEEDINDKVEATIGALYLIVFVAVLYVLVCVAYD